MKMEDITIASMAIIEQTCKLMQVAIATQDEEAIDLLRKHKRVPVKLLISAAQGRARRAAMNLMHGEVYAESIAMSSEAIRALDSGLLTRSKGGPEQMARRSHL